MKDKTKLFVSWFVEPMLPHYKSKPDTLVEWCLGHEGPGSLLSKLKKEQLATSLDAG